HPHRQLDASPIWRDALEVFPSRLSICSERKTITWNLVGGGLGFQTCDCYDGRNAVGSRRGSRGFSRPGFEHVRRGIITDHEASPTFPAMSRNSNNCPALDCEHPG